MHFKEVIDNVKLTRRVKKVKDDTSRRSQEHSQETSQDEALLPLLVTKAMLLPSVTMVVFRPAVFYRSSSSTSLVPFLLHGLDFKR